MTVKYKVLKDFQLITEDKKIIIIKSKTIIENYAFKNKNEVVKVPVEVIKNNPDYFATFDWKEELQSFLRTNKIPQPAIITKKIVPFIESLMEDSGTSIKEVMVEKEVIKEVIVEKPKIVEKEVIKEVFVDKPKIVEKEVLVEKIVKDQSTELELEMKLNKLSLKEKQLDQEISEVNQKELDLQKIEKSLSQKEDELTKKEDLLESKSKELTTLENKLSKRESILLDKESNFVNYFKLSDLDEIIENIRRTKGSPLEIYDEIRQRLLQS